MEKEFDPYHKWLGIPPEEQPAHLYRLLGLPLFETEPDVIENCADQRTALLRTFQSGKHSDLSQKLLNEISSAKLELLDPEKKLVYDKQLRGKLKSKRSQDKPAGRPKPKTRAPSSKKTSAPKQANLPTAEPLDLKPAVNSATTRRRSGKKKSMTGPAVLLGIGGVLAVVIVVVLLSAGGSDLEEGDVSSTDKTPPIAENPYTSDTAPDKTTPTKQIDNPSKPPVKPKKPPAVERPPEAELPASPLKKKINLINLVDVRRDAIRGNWKVERGVLTIPSEKFPRLQIPFQLPEEYQLDMVAVKRKGIDCLGMGIASGGHQFLAVFDGWKGTHSGLDMIDNQRALNTTPAHPEPIFTAGERRVISIQMRPSRVRALVDGKEVIQWQGDFRRLSLHDDWKAPSPNQLFLGAYQTAFEIHKLTIGPVREGESPSGAAGSTEPLVYLDDLPEASFEVGYGTLGKHGATGYSDPEDPREFRYQDSVPEHALSVHPAASGSSYVSYFIDGKYDTLKVTGAIMQAEVESKQRTPLSFKVFGDGTLLWESQPLEKMGQGEDCQVSTADVHVLRLQVDCPGPGAMRRAVWIDPRLESGGAPDPSEEVEEIRLAIPDSTLRDLSEAKIRELFAAEIKEATSAGQKVSLADRFLNLARENSDDQVARFVLFQQGWNLAIEAGVAEKALEAVVDLAGLYEVDSLKMRISTLSRVARTALGKEKSIALANDALPMIEEALKLEDYKAAEEIGKIALAAARKASDTDLVKQIAARNKVTAEITKAAEEAKYAQATLEKDPNNPGANLIAGRFLCFLMDDWPTGLPLLALSGDQALVEVAKVELAESSDPKDHARLGDMWWDLAKSESDVIRQRLLERSSFWYGLAHPQLRDRQLKATVEKRLAIIDQRYGAGKAVSRLEETWISREATYTVSSQFFNKRPLAALLNDEESLHDGGEFSFHTAKFDPAPAIVIDLQSEMPVTRLQIENRRKIELYGRARGLTLFLSSSPTDRGDAVWTAPSIAASWEVQLKKPIKARYVTLAIPPENREMLHLAKVKLFGYSSEGIAIKTGKGKNNAMHRVLGYELQKHPEGAIPFGGHWYALIPEDSSWLVAQERCKQMGGYLICVEYPAEALLVRQLAGNRFVWLGGIKINNRWGWINGSPMVFTNWGRGEPNNTGGGENRLEAKWSARWNDAKGGGRRKFICEWEF